MSHSPIKLILADKHNLVREGLKQVVQTQPDMQILADTADGLDLLDMCRVMNPHLVVMGLYLERLAGIQACQTLARFRRGINVLILTSDNRPESARRAIAAGARGYILKSARSLDWFNAIRQVARGELYLDAEIAPYIVDCQCASSQLAVPDAEGEQLSERERIVLGMLANGLSNKEISAQLRISSKTVETYKARAMEKLSLRSRAEIIHYALARGWLVEGTPGS